MELGGAVGAVWPKDPVPVVQFVCGYVVVLGEDETVVASLGFGILVTIRSNFALSGVLEILASRRWLGTSAGGTLQSSWYTNAVIVTDPELCGTIMPIGVSKGRVPGCQLRKCNVEALRYAVTCIVGSGIRKSIAIFRNTDLCRGTRSTISCGAIGSGRTIRVCSASLTPSLLSGFVGIGAADWPWQNIPATGWSALNVRDR